MKSASFKIHDNCLGTGYAIGQRVVRKKFVVCFTYALLLLLVISGSILVSKSISISFVNLLNCLYFYPRVLPFVHFSCPSCWGGQGRGERVAVSFVVASFGLNYDTQLQTSCLRAVEGICTSR